MSYYNDVFLRSTAKLPATSRQPEVTYTSCARLTLLRYSSGLEPGDSSPVHISPCYNEVAVLVELAHDYSFLLLTTIMHIH